MTENMHSFTPPAYSHMYVDLFFCGVLVNPVPGSCFQEVSAAQLCLNDLYHVFFTIWYIVPCSSYFLNPFSLNIPISYSASMQAC